MDSISEIMLAIGIGFLLGTIVVACSLDNYARIYTNKADGQKYFTFQDVQYVGQVVSNTAAIKE